MTKGDDMNKTMTILQERLIRAVYEKKEELNALLKNASNENLMCLVEVVEGGTMVCPYPKLQVRVYAPTKLVVEVALPVEGGSGGFEFEEGAGHD